MLWLAGLLVIAALAFVLKASHNMQDFEVYWRAATRALAGEPLYRAEDGHWLFKYLPVFAVVMAPIALLPIELARTLWFAVMIGALVFLLRTLVTLLPARRKPAWVLVGAAIVVMGKFYAHEFLLGQSNLLLTAFVVGALLALRDGRERTAGVLIVVAIVLKPYAVIFLPRQVARRRFGSILSATLGLVALLLIPIARYGIAATVQLHLDWWHTVITSIDPNLLSPENVSWIAMYSRWAGPGRVARSLAVATTLAALALVAYAYRLRRPLRFPELAEASLLLMLMPLMSPQGWDYTLLVGTPAVMCLVNDEDRLPAPLRAGAVAALAAIGLSIYDVMGRQLYVAFMRQSGITLAFFVLIGALFELRRRRVA
jgi:alpha-1,2-mannosyltransferase